MQKFRNNPEAEVTVYRAVPEGASNKVNRGDWVTLTEAYAKIHGDSNLGENYKIIKNKVKVKDIYTNGDSIHEFGYDGGVTFSGMPKKLNPKTELGGTNISRIPKSTSQKSIKDLPEDVQKEYTTFEANEGGFAGDPAEGFGLGELSVNVSNAHVRNTNSVSVNADFALGKNTPEREIFKEQIEKPLAQSKG